jgi:hypothetical protein
MMDTTPTGMAIVTFSMLDALCGRLVEKDVLNKQDLIAIFQQTRASLAAAEDPEMRRAVELLDHLYKE